MTEIIIYPLHTYNSHQSRLQVKHMDEVAIETLFGENAGKVWMALSKHGEKSIPQLSKETKLKANDVCAALGWLGREGKLKVKKDKATVTFSLSENN